jgi:hypothetical protein
LPLRLTEHGKPFGSCTTVLCIALFDRAPAICRILARRRPALKKVSLFLLFLQQITSA